MNKPTLILFSFIILFSISLSAQSSVKLGKITINISGQLIRSVNRSYSNDRHYLHFKNDTAYYYEVSFDPDDNSCTSVELSTFPLKAIKMDDLKLKQCTTEFVTGITENECATIVWLYYKKSATGWTYTYNQKGKIKKEKEDYFWIYSDDRTVFDLLKSKMNEIKN